MSARQYTQYMVQEILEWKEFEDLCTSFLRITKYPNIRQAGRTSDGGRDAAILHDRKEQIVFAFSKEKKPFTGRSRKFFREYKKWQDKGLAKFVYVTSEDAGHYKIDLEKELDNPPAEVLDITDIVDFLDFHESGIEVKKRHGLDSPVILATNDNPQVVPCSRYTILSLRDVSHGAAKRYSANILLDVPHGKEAIVELVQELVSALKAREYYRNQITRVHWQGKDADIVWLFVYPSLEDEKNSNWVCRAQWVNPDLDPRFTPSLLNADQIVDGVRIDWKPDYDSWSQTFHNSIPTKESYLNSLGLVVQPLRNTIETAIQLTSAFEIGAFQSEQYINQMALIESQVSDLYSAGMSIGLAPVECADVAIRFHTVLAQAHNIVLPFTENGLNVWPEMNRKFLVKHAIIDYQKELSRLEYELEKIQ